MSTTQWVLGGCCAAVLAVGLLVGLYTLVRTYGPDLFLTERGPDRLRREQWAVFALAIGCRLQRQRQLTALPETLWGWPLARPSYQVEGRYRNRLVRCCDSEYTESDHGASSAHTVTLVTVEAPVSFPPLTIRPHQVADHLPLAQEREGIDFESADFDRRFWVGCADRQFAQAVVHRRVMRFLIGQDDLEVHAERDSVLFMRGVDVGRVASARLLRFPGAVRDLVERGCDFMDLLPEHLVRDRGKVDTSGPCEDRI